MTDQPKQNALLRRAVVSTAVTAVGAMALATQAFAEGQIPAWMSPEVMNEFYRKLFTFAGWIVGGAAMGAVLCRTVGRNSKTMREILFPVSCMASMTLGFYQFLGKPLW